MFLNSRSYSYTCLFALFLLLFNPSAELIAQPCSYSIAYGLVEGKYTDILGKVDPEISEIIEQLIRHDPAYCDMEIRIEFLVPFASRQLAYKHREDDEHFFRIAFRAPEYKLTIRNAERLIIHQETFAEDWAKAVFPQDGQRVSSKAALYQRWNDQRIEIYTQLEESYNNYEALKVFLNSLVPADSAVAAADSSSAPKVAPFAPPPSKKRSSPPLTTQLKLLTEEEAFPDFIRISALVKRKNKSL